MSALPIESAAPAVDLTDLRAVLALARSYGPLRAVDPDQAPVIRVATEHDRRFRPRWQRGGEGIHEHAEPSAYSSGLTWTRTPAVRSIGPNGAGWRSDRVAVRTGRPHVNWRNRRHWLDVVVPAAIAARPEALVTPRGRVSAKRVLEWATEVSKFAHESTGRRCIVRVDRLAELMGVTKSTVQRCQAAAEALGLYVVVVPGRMLTEDETYAARRSGSRQRGLANDAALVIPSHLDREALQGPLPARRRPVDNSGTRRRLQAVPTPPETENDTPTSGSYGTPHISPLRSSFGGRKRFAGGQEPASPAHLEGEPGNPDRYGHARRGKGSEQGGSGPRSARRRVYDPQALQVARDLVAALSWLSGVEPGRLEPMLRRFARCVPLAWTAADIVAAIDAANRTQGRASMTADLVRAPVGLLAAYLRERHLDHDHPRAGRAGADQSPRPVESARQLENRLLLEAHRHGAGAGQTPEVRAGALRLIRGDLDARRDNQR